ncbi:hypothetical protein [Lactobacillus sp. UCMA15818]|nr:hypothetical protein [Lactobacillus sp. UCMA15818]
MTKVSLKVKIKAVAEYHTSIQVKATVVRKELSAVINSWIEYYNIKQIQN